MYPMKLPTRKVKCFVLRPNHEYVVEWGELVLDVIRARDGTVRLGSEVFPCRVKPRKYDSVEEVLADNSDHLRGEPFEFVALFREGHVLCIPSNGKPRSALEEQALMDHFNGQVKRIREFEDANNKSLSFRLNALYNYIALAGINLALVTGYLKLLNVLGLDFV